MASRYFSNHYRILVNPEKSIRSSIVFSIKPMLSIPIFSPIPPGSETANRTATYQSIYWVPKRWKPSAWAGIVQLDRYFPMGRIVFLGHFILWLLFYFDSAPFIRNSYLFLFVLLQNTSIYLLLNKRIGPVSWNYRIQKPTDWILTRFFIQIRWLLPFILSLIITRYIHRFI